MKTVFLLSLLGVFSLSGMWGKTGGSYELFPAVSVDKQAEIKKIEDNLPGRSWWGDQKYAYVVCVQRKTVCAYDIFYDSAAVVKSIRYELQEAGWHTTDFIKLYYLKIELTAEKEFEELVRKFITTSWFKTSSASEKAVIGDKKS